MISRHLELAESSMMKETNLTVPLKNYFGTRKLAAIRKEDILNIASGAPEL
jgi:hypothetical protein